MWLFLTAGFVSVVQHRDDSSKVLVRSRVRADLQGILERYVDRKGDVVSNQGTDYPFRAVISKDELREMLGRSVADVDYGNFKIAAGDGDIREEIYHRVWNELRGLEEIGGTG